MARVGAIVLALCASVGIGKMFKGQLEVDLDGSPLEDLQVEKAKTEELAEQQKANAKDASMKRQTADQEAAAAVAKLKAAEELVKAAAEAAARAKAAGEEAARIQAANMKAAELAKKQALETLMKEEAELTRQMEEFTQKSKTADQESVAAEEKSKQANMKRSATMQMANAAVQKAKVLEAEAKSADLSLAKAQAKKAAATDAATKARNRRAMVLAADEKRIKDEKAADDSVDGEEESEQVTKDEQEGESKATEDSAGAEQTNESTTKDEEEGGEREDGVNSTKSNETETKKAEPTELLLLGHSAGEPALEELADVKAKAIETRNAHKVATNQARVQREKADEEAEVSSAKLKAATAVMQAVTELAAKAKATDEEAVRVEDSESKSLVAAQMELAAAMQHERDELEKQETTTKAAQVAAEKEFADATNTAQQANLRKAAATQMAQAALRKANLTSAEANKAEAELTEANKRKAFAGAMMKQAQERLTDAKRINAIKSEKISSDSNVVQIQNDAAASPSAAVTAENASPTQTPGMWAGGKQPESITTELKMVLEGPAKKNLQIIGLQNSGADLLNYLVRANIGNVVNYCGLGEANSARNKCAGLWRHTNLKTMHQAHKDVLNKMEGESTYVVAVVRNPLSWLQTMRDEPAEFESCVKGDDWLTRECHYDTATAPDAKDAVSYPSIAKVWNNWVGNDQHANAFGLSRVNVVKYEDLIRQPSQTLAQIGSFLGIDVPKEGWTALPPNTESPREQALSALTGKHYLSRYDGDQKSKVCGDFDTDLMKAFDYADC